MKDHETLDVILASTSVYRRRLLERLGLPFACEAPNVEESEQAGETPAAMARRLAAQKAVAVSRLKPNAKVLGSDQVAAIDGRLLRKPKTHEKACAQLRQSSARTVAFYTAVCLAQAGEVTGQALVPTVVHFRSLSEKQIDCYVKKEQPFDCAGSFRWEALGIALFRALESSDPTALEGLPLIATVDLLHDAGIDVLANRP